MKSWMWLSDNDWNLLVEMSTYKQAIKLTFGSESFGKKEVQKLPTKIHF